MGTRAWPHRSFVVGLAVVAAHLLSTPAVASAADSELIIPAASTLMTIQSGQLFVWLPFDAALGVPVTELRVLASAFTRGDDVLPGTGLATVIVPSGQTLPEGLPCSDPPLAQPSRYDRICVGFPAQEVAGSYVIQLTLSRYPQTVPAAVQNVALTLVRKAAQITTSQPVEFDRDQQTPFGRVFVDDKPLLIKLSESGGRSQITGISIQQQGQAKVGSGPISGVMEIDPAREGEPGLLRLRWSGVHW